MRVYFKEDSHKTLPVKEARAALWYMATVAMLLGAALMKGGI